MHDLTNLATDKNVTIPIPTGTANHSFCHPNNIILASLVQT